MTEKDEKTLMIGAIINPFHIFESDKSPETGHIKIERILRFFEFNLDDQGLALASERYKRLQAALVSIVIIPGDSKIFEKLSSPLKQAVGSFLLGSFTGSIALCGYLAEMIAILLFDSSEIKIQKSVLDENLQKKLFGQTFERLGQERRINVLRSYEIIDAETEEDLLKIKELRNKYLHYWSRDGLALENDAEDSIVRVVRLFHVLFPQKFVNGQMHATQNLIRYFNKRSQELAS